METIEIYRALRRELDKYQAPVLDVGDFNYFFNSAIDEYVSNNYDLFDVKQKELDDIQVLVVRSNLTLDNPPTSADLPADYRNFLEVSLGIQEEDTRCSTTNTFTDSAKKLEADKLGYIKSNAYLKPGKDNLYYTIRGNKIFFEIGEDPNLTIVSATLEYLKKPTKVFLDPDRAGADANGVVGTDVNSDFPDYVELEIIKVARRIILENFESPRYRTQIPETQLRNE